MCSTCSKKDMIWDSNMQEERKTLLENNGVQLNLICKSNGLGDKFYLEAREGDKFVRYTMSRCITCGKLYG